MNHETAAPVEQRHGKGSSLRETNDFVSVVVGDQLFGIPVLEVRDVLASQRNTSGSGLGHDVAFRTNENVGT